MTFTDVVTAVSEYCLLTSPEAKTRVGKAVNRHYRRITASLGLDAARFVTRSATTTNGVRTVIFTEIEKIDRLLDTTDSTNVTLLGEISVHQARSIQPSNGAPCQWAFQNADADSVTVLLDTVPQTAYTLQADGSTTLADLSGTQEPVFPESYHDILVWAVISEELLKKEKDKLAGLYHTKAETLLSELRFFLADSHTKQTQQGQLGSPFALGGSSGGGTGNLGGTAYTQSALLTFDRGAGLTPFAVAESDAPYVVNLGAEFLGNVTTDRLIGRDTAGTGESEQLQVSGGLEFTGSGGIQRSAITGDVAVSAGSAVSAIVAGAITNAKVSASAAIARSKLDFGAGLVNADVAAAAAIAYSKLSLGTSIVNADISASAAIAASKVTGTVPVGGMIPFGGSSAPSKWLLCDGSSLLRASYVDLFAAIGTTYGTVDGTHFTLPDLRQRFPLGKAASGTGSTLGSTGGAIDHTHTGPAHTHTGPAHTHGLSTQAVTGQSGAGFNITNLLSTTTDSSGTGATSSDGTGATGGER